MTPAEYVTEIVVPTVRECRDSRLSRRHAYLACIVTFHIKDHLKKAGVTASIENAMRSACPDDFDVVRAVCNGTKHVETNATHPVPFTAGEDYDRPPAVLGEMVLGVSMLGDTVGARVLHHQDKNFDLYDSVKKILVEFKNQFPHHLGSCDLSDC